MSPTIQLSPLKRQVLTATVSLCTGIVAMDMTISGVILPVMQGSLKASIDQLSWIMTSYIVAAAIMTPLSGALTAPFGRKTVFMMSLAGFALTSFLCGIAADLPQMVIFRVLQGLCGAAIMPLSQSIIFDMYEAKDHPRAYGMYILGVLGAPMIGPLVGGFLTEAVSWRWAFLINVPLTAVALVLFGSLMPPRKRVRKFKLDFLGFALLALALACFQLVLDRGTEKGWYASTEIFFETVIAAGALYFFIIHIISYKAPFIDMALFRDRNYVSGLLVNFIVAIGIFAPMYLVPAFLQQLQGYTTIDAGLLIAPRSLGSAISILWVPRLLKHISPRYICIGGAFFLACGSYGMHAYTLEVGTFTVIVTGIIHGMGVSAIFVPVNSLSLGSLRPELRDQAAALFQLIRNAGASVGIAISVNIMTSTTDTSVVQLYNLFTDFNTRAMASANSFFDMNNAQSLYLLKMELLRQSGMIGFQNACLALVAASILAIPFILTFRMPNDAGVFDWIRRLAARMTNAENRTYMQRQAG